MPAADASQCVEATIPNVPMSSGRVVNEEVIGTVRVSVSAVSAVRRDQAPGTQRR